jgi:hypothetical protein
MQWNTIVPTIAFMIVAILASSLVIGPALALTSNSSTTSTNATTTKIPFHSVFDTFIVPGSDKGYGMYQAHNSSIFKPGEKITLYVEPAGFSYKPFGSQFLMNFTADVVISDKAGQIRGGVQNLPVSLLLSHHQNKELDLTIGLTQNHPFPLGDYVLRYTIHDVSSGSSFDILKNIRIATG